MYQVYQITNNDTLDIIANRFNTTIEELINLNGSINFEPGLYIVVPNTNNVERYIIKQGDTIYSIASKYNIDPNVLILMNGLNKDDYIYPNETIILPKNGLKAIVTNDNSTIEDILSLGDLEEIMTINKKIYLLPQQIILYRKEK